MVRWTVEDFGEDADPATVGEGWDGQPGIRCRLEVGDEVVEAEGTYNVHVRAKRGDIAARASILRAVQLHMMRQLIKRAAEQEQQVAA